MQIAAKAWKIIENSWTVLFLMGKFYSRTGLSYITLSVEYKNAVTRAVLKYSLSWKCRRRSVPEKSLNFRLEQYVHVPCLSVAGRDSKKAAIKIVFPWSQLWFSAPDVISW